LISDQTASCTLFRRPAENENRAIVRFEKAEQRVNRRCLSCSVRSDESDNRFALDLQVEIANGVNRPPHEAGAVGFRETFDFNRWGVHCRVDMLATKSAAVAPSINTCTRGVAFESTTMVYGRLRMPNFFAIVCPGSARTGNGNSFTNRKFGIS